MNVFATGFLIKKICVGWSLRSESLYIFLIVGSTSPVILMSGM